MPEIGELTKLLEVSELTPEEFGGKLSELFKTVPELGVEVEIRMMKDTKETYFYVNRQKNLVAYASGDGEFVISENGAVIDGNPVLLESLKKLGDSIFEEPLDNKWKLVERRENKVRFELKIKGSELEQVAGNQRVSLKKYLESREYELGEDEVLVSSVKVLVPKRRLAIPIKIKTYQRVFLGGKAIRVFNKIVEYSKRNRNGQVVNNSSNSKL